MFHVREVWAGRSSVHKASARDGATASSELASVTRSVAAAVVLISIAVRIRVAGEMIRSVQVRRLSRRQVLLGSSAAVVAATAGGTVVSGASAHSAGSFGSSGSFGSTDPNIPGLPSAVKDELRRLTDSRRILGCSVAVVNRDRTVAVDAWGSARAGRAMTASSTLNIGSITKTMTATAVLQLVASGRIKLSTDVNDILRQSKLFGPGRVRSPFHQDVPIQIRHLLTHLTPLASGTDPGPYGYSYRRGAVAEPAELGRWLHDFLTPTPRGWTYNADHNFTKSVPGEAHMYSDVAYNLAGHIVQAVTGQYFGDYCREEILLPSGMTCSDFDRDRLSVDDRAHPHAWFEDGVKVGMWPDYRNLIPRDVSENYTGHVEYAPYTTCLVPDGGLRSNALDLARWTRLWLGEGSIDGREILPRHLAAAALGDQVPSELLARSESPVEMIAQGFAWMRLRGDNDGVWQHAGSEFGTATYVMLDTKRGVGAVVLCNTEVGIDADPRPQMLQILLEKVVGA